MKGCIDLSEVGYILICEHAYHFECFLFKLKSQCQYCINYFISGIEKNCKNYQKALISFNKIIINKGRNKELDNTETTYNTNINSKDFSLNNNINLLFENIMNTLTNT